MLSHKCLACHGPDDQHRKADLRLDTREDATAHAVVPGNPHESELLRRILSQDPDEVMPLPAHNKKLTADEITKLTRWIEAGAPWGKHWFFEKPVKAQVPSGGHPVDALVQVRLSKGGMTLPPEAEKHTLLRRVSFDLTGLPPTLEELAADVSYEAHIDRLLDSPHFGERMAMWWLDAARYSDTDGFQADAERNNWPWRDWVVDAFNENKRFELIHARTIHWRLITQYNARTKTGNLFSSQPHDEWRGRTRSRRVTSRICSGQSEHDGYDLPGFDIELHSVPFTQIRRNQMGQTGQTSFF